MFFSTQKSPNQGFTYSTCSKTECNNDKPVPGFFIWFFFVCLSSALLNKQEHVFLALVLAFSHIQLFYPSILSLRHFNISGFSKVTQPQPLSFHLYIPDLGSSYSTYSVVFCSTCCKYPLRLVDFAFIAKNMCHT